MLVSAWKKKKKGKERNVNSTLKKTQSSLIPLIIINVEFLKSAQKAKYVDNGEFPCFLGKKNKKVAIK